MFTKTEINELKRARKYCLINAQHMALGSNASYPSYDDISKAGKMLDLAERIDKMILAQIGDNTD